MGAEESGLIQFRIWLCSDDLLWGGDISEKRRATPHLEADGVADGREQLAGCAYLTFVFVLARTCRGQAGSLAYLQQSGFLLHSSRILVFGV